MTHPCFEVSKILLTRSGMLAAIVLAKLGAEVVATDLGPNLRLLKENCQANNGQSHSTFLDP